MLSLKAATAILSALSLTVALATPLPDPNEPITNTTLAARQGNPNQGDIWAVNFYSDLACQEFVSYYLSDEAGTPMPCTTQGLEGKDAIAVEWVPGDNRVFKVSGEECGFVTQQWSDFYRGCVPVSQHIGVVRSWEVAVA
ncbi:hypothetical protein BJY04DRAFT_217374 [Aspergillus karnatakaensis]|uniref:uncharacterized protein n=1 Tax=Aspergillus karnatakaensis TaxID=1810916 RepID=UPI003CCDD29C